MSALIRNWHPPICVHSFQYYQHVKITAVDANVGLNVPAMPVLIGANGPLPKAIFACLCMIFCLSCVWSSACYVYDLLPVMCMIFCLLCVWSSASHVHDLVGSTQWSLPESESSAKQKDSLIISLLFPPTSHYNVLGAFRRKRHNMNL